MRTKAWAVCRAIAQALVGARGSRPKIAEIFRHPPPSLMKRREWLGASGALAFVAATKLETPGVTRSRVGVEFDEMELAKVSV